MMIERYQLQPNEITHIHLNAGIRLKSLCIRSVNKVAQNNQIESLWGKRWDLELCMEPNTVASAKFLLDIYIHSTELHSFFGNYKTEGLKFQHGIWSDHLW